MVRLFKILILTTVCLSVAAQTAPRSTPSVADTQFASGLSSYRAGNYQDAANQLSAAAQSFLSADQMQKYVTSGRFENLGGFEMSLIYLTLAQVKLGNEDAARESILRLMTAERIAPTYATLSLNSDAAEFEPLAKRLLPESTLPANTLLAQAAPQPAPTPVPSPVTPPPPVQTAQVQPQPQQPAPMQTIVVPAPEPSVPAMAQTSAAQSAEAERAERERYIEQRLAEERAKIQKAADERIATERAAIQSAADARVAAAQRDAEARIAAERAAIQRTSIPDITDVFTRREYLARLRDAEGFVATGDLRRAAGAYASLARQGGVPRDILAEAATGLYRTGAYREAADAFTRLGTFARGEEDLRYYHAVVLYETGNYDAAKHELSCALPFIQVTEDVTRYRNKIEQTTTRQVNSPRTSPAT